MIQLKHSMYIILHSVDKAPIPLVFITFFKLYLIGCAICTYNKLHYVNTILYQQP